MTPVVVVCMPERGHLQRLLPMIAGIAGRGRIVYVLTDPRYQPQVAQAGGRLIDLFQHHPLHDVDASSIPVPSRYVTFAATSVDSLTPRVAALKPGLILYDTFAVVAPLIARRLDLPYLNVCACHAAVPAQQIAELRQDPRVATSAACHAAVQRLQDCEAMPNAHPFSYIDNPSPFLNIYGEPPQFLDPASRAAFEPLAFFGSLAPELQTGSAARSPFRPGTRARTIYVSFGTVIWRYYQATALAAFEVLANAVAGLENVEAVFGLGGHAVDPALCAPLQRPNVRIASYLDQWSTLQTTNLFVTHHGLNSTHEAIYHRVPMISYPFFSDQPALAERCRQLGLAVPLTTAPRAPISLEAVRNALQTLTADPTGFANRLEQARGWELETIAGRPAVIDQICAFAR